MEKPLVNEKSNFWSFEKKIMAPKAPKNYLIIIETKSIPLSLIINYYEFSCFGDSVAKLESLFSGIEIAQQRIFLYSAHFSKIANFEKILDSL